MELRAVPLLFPVAVFVSAALLFLVEPMFARMVLPKLGGAPAVWNTCVAFYQALLLAGYAYAHVLAERLRAKTQIAIQLTLILMAALWLPVGVAAAWTPAPFEHPSLTVIRWLLRGLGLPFFVLAASGPLFQQWFALSRGAGSNPYRLYAASNAGSLLALLAYPVAIEPTLRLRAQSLLWAAGYAALAFIAVGCGLAAWNAQSADPRATGSSHGYGSARHTGGSGPVAIPSHPVRIPWSTRVRWLGLRLSHA